MLFTQMGATTVDPIGHDQTGLSHTPGDVTLFFKGGEWAETLPKLNRREMGIEGVAMPLDVQGVQAVDLQSVMAFVANTGLIGGRYFKVR